MKKPLVFALFISITLASTAQGVLSLQQCREMALQNNRQLKISKMTASIAENIHKSAKTKYLPRITGMAGYEHLTREVSLLNDQQKSKLSNFGTNSVGKVGGQIGESIAGLVQQGLISPEAAQQLGSVLGKMTAPIAQAGDNIGQSIRDAFRSNTKNIYAGSIMLTQPIYMGGAIKAANDIATIGEDVARNDIALKQQTVIYAVDNVYWLAVSLKKKKLLAEKFRDLAKQLSSNVQKMYQEGVATKADGLKVDVSVNTAELKIAEIENGISLAKMALCELCGLSLNGNLQLADEDTDELSAVESVIYNPNDTAFDARPEVRLLQNTIDISRQNTKLIQALYRPHVALTGGYTVSNPNMFNGFQQKFSDVWNIGIVVHVPIWSWGESKYRVRASQAATTIAQMELSDVRNKIQLEVEQYRFRLKTANERLATAHKNMVAAEENLRTADIGFKEGVMTVTDVMIAQTAWMTAKTAIVDAEIAVRTAQVGLKKATGTLN